MPFIENLDFGDVTSDTEFVTKATELNNWMDKINRHIQLAAEYASQVETLNTEDTINYKLFMAYALNSLCWIQLRLQGIDPNTHPVKTQLQRIRQLMQKRDEIVDRKNRPSLNKEAAKRFIRSGLWDPKQKDDMQLGVNNKKIKFSD